MKFSIILNSRGRPHLLTKLLDSILETVSNINDIEVLISCDIDDETMWGYCIDKYPFVSILYINRDLNLISRLNNLALSSIGRYVFVLNDDCEIIDKNWDVNVFQQLEEYLVDKQDRIVLGKTQDDSCDKIGDYSSFPIISREGIRALQTFIPHEFMAHGGDVVVDRVYKSVSRTIDLDIGIKHTMHNMSGVHQSKDETALSMINTTFNNRTDYFTFDISHYTEKLNSKISSF